METEIKNANYSIGIVTYHARFEEYFQPLIKRLVSIFPDHEILVVMNGHPDRDRQIRYLQKATAFLSQLPNVRYLTHLDNQSLSLCWNELVLLANTENLLLLNDDTEVSELFRHELEPYVSTHPLITFNHSWSHFLISKEAVRQAGWFDERFPGVGYEDSDYAYRLSMVSIPIKNVNSHGLRNFVAANPDAGWHKLTRDSSKKHGEVNLPLFQQKWSIPGNSHGHGSFAYFSDFGGGRSPFSPVAGMETPMFYDLSLLDNIQIASRLSERDRQTSRWLLFWQSIYFRGGRKVARTLRAALSLVK